MGEKQGPRVIQPVHIQESPGRTAQAALRMAGVKSLPLSTSMLNTIAQECFDIPSQQGNQGEFLLDRSNTFFPESSHRKRYKTALEIGENLYGGPCYNRDLFARSLLMPVSLVTEFFRKNGRTRNGLSEIATFALRADVPTLAVLHRLHEIRNIGLNPKRAVVGFSDQLHYGENGFIFTNRSVRPTAGEFLDIKDRFVEDGDYHTNSLVAARTEYNNNVGIYTIDQVQKYGFKRPNGENETLVFLNLGRKRGEFKPYMGEQLEVPGATVIRLDTYYLSAAV